MSNEVTLESYKENLFLILKSKRENRLEKSLYTFLLYTLISRGLWFKGYFPYFFYYTKYTPSFLLFISFYLIDYNFRLESYKYDLNEYFYFYSNQKERNWKINLIKFIDYINI